MTVLPSRPMEAPLPPPPPPAKGGALKWFLLGCGGLVVLGAIGAGVGVYMLVGAVAGTEVASAPGVGPGQESAVTFQVTEPVPYALWIEYSVAFQGGDFRLEGPIQVRTAAGVIAQDTLTLGPDGTPTAGGFSRIVVNSRNVNINGQGSSSARVKLLELPVQAPGTAVTAGVTVMPRPGTMLNALRLVITK